MRNRNPALDDAVEELLRKYLTAGPEARKKIAEAAPLFSDTLDKVMAIAMRKFQQP